MNTTTWNIFENFLGKAWNPAALFENLTFSIKENLLNLFFNKFKSLN